VLNSIVIKRKNNKIFQNNVLKHNIITNKTILEKINIYSFQLNSGSNLDITLTYQIFGQPIGTAPVVLVNHALTGNSQVIGENGWWNELIGEQKTIDTKQYTIIAFNIPGNGYNDDNNVFQNYKDFTTNDIAKIFWIGLNNLNVKQLFAVIGGSLGGAIAWEMTLIKPENVQNLIPIATHWVASDWVIGNVLIQDLILNNSKNPVYDARIHAMLLYRTANSLAAKFNSGIQNENNSSFFQVESWLLHHGEKLQKRFQLAAYKLMNHLLKTTNVLKTHTVETFANEIQSNIHLVAVDTDYFFTASDIKMCHESIKKFKKNVYYNEINSIHGHDAFLIEFEQLNKILEPVFNTKS
jgi:homoserine O-acetyltransferase/O-succinyltransferase